MKIPKSAMLLMSLFFAIAFPFVLSGCTWCSSPDTITIEQTRKHLAKKGLNKSVSELKILEELHASNQDLKDEDVKYLQPLVKLRELDLSRNPGITDKGFSVLRHLKDLAWLNLNKTSIGASGMKHVCGLPQLETLYLDDTPLDGDALKCLSEHKKLKTLSIRNTRIGNSQMAKLAGIPTLVNLRLDGTVVNDDGLKVFASECRLKSIHLTGIGDKGLSHLGACRDMENLSLTNGSLTGDGMKTLKSFSRLEDLNLSANKVTDGGVAHLSALARLAVLDLEDNKAITDGALSFLKGLEKLVSLNLRGTSVTKVGVADFSGGNSTCNVSYSE